MSAPVDLATVRQQTAEERATDERDLAMIRELERRFIEASADVSELGGVSIEYLDALMRSAWGLPESAEGWRR